MPLYDCGDRYCDECQREFGPNREKAIRNYEAREAYYTSLQPRTTGSSQDGGRQAARGGGEQAEKASELAPQIMTECARCKGTGITGHRLSGTYVGAGPVPEDARRFYEARCDECRGVGSALFEIAEA